MPKIIHFEISADDPTRALCFMRASLAGASTNGKDQLSLVSTDDRDQTIINGAIRQRMRDKRQLIPSTFPLSMSSRRG